MSTVKFDTWQNTDGTENYKCRAWCKFDGTSANITSTMTGGNVSSITDNGIGDYTVNFTNAMPDANYTITSALSRSLTAYGYTISAPYSIVTTSSVGVLSHYINSAVYDSEFISIAIFR